MSIFPTAIWMGLIEPKDNANIILPIISLFLFIILVIAKIRGTILRLHDLNWHAFWSLIFIWPILDIVLICLPGQSQTNQFGEPPISKGDSHKIVSIALLVMALFSIIPAILMYVFLVILFS